MADKPYHHGNLPEALLTAVAELISEQGASSVSLRQVSRRAGVSPAAPSHHFGDKRGMMTAFASQGLDLFNRRLDRALRTVSSPSSRDGIRAVGHAYVSFAVENPEHFAVIFRPELYDTQDPNIRESGDESFAKLRRLIEGHQRSGWRSSEDTLALSVSVWAALHGLASLWLYGLVDESLRQQGIESLIDTLLKVAVGTD